MRIILTLSTLLLLWGGQIAHSQTTFNYKNDFKKLLAQTKSKKSKLSYERLLNRFQSNDQTLTNFEVLVLLIGFTGQPEYKPYIDLSTENEIYQLNDKGKYQESLEKANLFLAKHPLNVKTLIEKSYSFYKLGNKDSAQYYMNQGNRIFEAMSFSGTGKEPGAPIFALGPADGQDYIIKYLGSKIGGAGIGNMGSGSDKDGNFLDILEVVPKDGTKAYHLYFIIQHATDKMFSSEDIKNMKQVLKEYDKSGKKKNK